MLTILHGAKWPVLMPGVEKSVDSIAEIVWNTRGGSALVAHI